MPRGTLLRSLCKKISWTLIRVILANGTNQMNLSVRQGGVVCQGGVVKNAAAAEPPFFLSYGIPTFINFDFFSVPFSTYPPMAAAMKCLKTLNQQL